jgi:single-strand DNA-binding protein
MQQSKERYELINRCVLVGRLTKDPELKYTPNGVAVATFTLAVNRQFANQQGEREADFLNIVVWRKLAENVANFLKKGSLAGVDGRIQVRTYDQDGKRQYFTEIIADSVQFLEPKNSKDNYQPPMDSPPVSKSNSKDGDPFNGPGQIDISDDDLPF